MNYVELKSDPKRIGMNETRDCSVLAIALACEGRFTYDRIHACLAMAGRRNRRGAYQHQIEKALKLLGVNFRRYYQAPRNTKLFAEHFNRGSFVVMVPRHYTACVRGTFADYVGDGRRARKIVAAWEVLP